MNRGLNRALNTEHTMRSLPGEQWAIDWLQFPAGWDTMQVVTLVTLVTLVLLAVNLLRTVTVPLSWPFSSAVELLSGTHES